MLRLLKGSSGRDYFELLDKNLYGLALRLDLLSRMKYKKSFSLLFAQDRAKALDVLREVAGGQESFRTLLEYVSIFVGEIED